MMRSVTARKNGLVVLSSLAIVTLLAAGIWLWGFGGDDTISLWAARGQQDVQNGLARGLRALKQGETGALLTLLSLCFAYGFFHAAGPGHGKVILGGYGLSQNIPLRRLSILAVASSLAQSATAIVLVLGGLSLLEWGRVQMTDITEDVLAPLSYGLIALVGLWLALRGLRKLRSHASQEHAHSHSHDGTCSSCGHKHGPTLDEAAQATTLRDGLAIIGAVAIRPCTGAIFLLLLTWRMDLMAAGIGGVIAMGLGTATVTLAVALAAVTFRASTLAQINSTLGLRLAAGLEILGGTLIVLVTSQLLWRAL